MSNRLLSISSDDLVNELIETPTIDAIWEEGTNLPSLIDAINESSTPARARFNALWVILRKDKLSYDAISPQVRAEILALSLAGRFVSNDQHWGKLWEGDEIGILGVQILTCREAAIPALVSLFGNQEPRSNYPGSEEATIMAIREYRVCDFASYFVAKIKSYPLPFHFDQLARDNEAEKMRNHLKL